MAKSRESIAQSIAEIDSQAKILRATGQDPEAIKADLRNSLAELDPAKVRETVADSVRGIDPEKFRKSIVDAAESIQRMQVRLDSLERQ